MLRPLAATLLTAATLLVAPAPPPLTLTQDAATSSVGGPVPSAAISLGASGNDSKVVRVTACDDSSQLDSPANASGALPVVPLKTTVGAREIRICSYALINGAKAQDVELISGVANTTTTGLKCSGTHVETYHMGPYQVIERGSGLGVLMTIPNTPGLCLSRDPSIAFTAEYTFAR